MANLELEGIENLLRSGKARASRFQIENKALREAGKL